MRREFLKKLNIIAILFFAASLFAYALMNGGAYMKRIRYAILLRTPLVSEELRAGEILEVAAAEKGIPEGGYELILPKIGVSTPVIIPKKDTKQDILAALEEGVGMYPGSAPIGADSGRSVILGHSSRAPWYRGNYQSVFSLLLKLEPGDEFFFIGNGKKYVYKVFSKQFLSPSATNEVLAGPFSGSEVDLITCYPIGSASQRTLIRASLVRVEKIE